MLDREFLRSVHEEVRSAVRAEMSAHSTGVDASRVSSSGLSEHLVSYEAAAMDVGLSASTIGAWTRSGRLTRHGTVRNALVDLAEVHQVMRGGGKRRAPTADDRAEQIANKKR